MKPKLLMLYVIVIILNYNKYIWSTPYSDYLHNWNNMNIDVEVCDKKKKKRSANFTPREYQILLGLVSKYNHIIENKKTDAVSTSDENEAWQKITAQFNTACPEFVNRSTESLKKYFDNKKREVRKRISEERKEVLLTGELLLSILDPLTVFGDKNEFDSDSIGIPKKSHTNDVVLDDNVLCFEFTKSDDDDDEVLKDNFMGEADNFGTKKQENTEVVNTNSQTNSSSTDKKINNNNGPGLTETSWKKQSIPNLKSKTSNILNRPLDTSSLPQVQSSKKKFDTSRRRPSSTTVRALSANDLAEKYQQLADKKIIVANYSLEKTQNDIKNCKEKHRLECEKLNNDINISKEEHNLRCKLLKLEILLKEKQLNSLF